MSNHMQATPKFLNSEYLKKLLREHFKENSLEIENFTVSPGSSVGDNYACQILRIAIQLTSNNQKKSLSIIGKIMPDTDVSKEFTKTLDFFKVENTMITEVLPSMYKKLCDRGDTERLFPLLYKLDTDNKIILMEDLKAQGFRMHGRHDLDLDHSLMAIKSLAKMHAASYLLLQENQNLKDKFSEYFFKKDEETVVAKYFNAAIPYVVNTLDLWPISEEDKNIMRSFQGKLYDLLCEGYERQDSSFNVIIHGDCWFNNMMFKYEEDKVVAVKLFDFQLSNFNSFALDLHYHLFSSAKVEVITENLEKVFETYYKTFISITGEIKGFNMERIWKEFIERLAFGFGIGTMFRASMLAPKAFDFDGFLEGKNTSENFDIFISKRFISDTCNLLPFFKKYGIFK